MTCIIGINNTTRKDIINLEVRNTPYKKFKSPDSIKLNLKRRIIKNTCEDKLTKDQVYDNFFMTQNQISNHTQFPITKSFSNNISKHRLTYYKREQRRKKQFESQYLVGKSFEIKAFSPYVPDSASMFKTEGNIQFIKLYPLL